MVTSEHRLVVSRGDHPERFAAYCYHNPPESDDFENMWIGNDRLTVEEAVADAERHAPGVPVKVLVEV